MQEEGRKLSRKRRVVSIAARALLSLFLVLLTVAVRHRTFAALHVGYSESC
jgi:flagellar biosynthesis/type III secretory pathway M-ring protein FliF/YscJ